MVIGNIPAKRLMEMELKRPGGWVKVPAWSIVRMLSNGWCWMIPAFGRRCLLLVSKNGIKLEFKARTYQGISLRRVEV